MTSTTGHTSYECGICRNAGSKYSAPNEGSLADHARAEHPIEVDAVVLPLDVHYSDPTSAKAQLLIRQWSDF